MIDRIYPAALTTTGSAFPSEVRDNAFFSEELGLATSDKWIEARTGIRHRRVARAENGETCASLATSAARTCLENRGMPAEELDAIVMATISSDLGFPATACLVQARLGATNACAMDISAACTGFLYALTTAAALVESGRFRKVMVIGSELMNAILDYTDRSTCVLFGDGAGAALVERVDWNFPGRILDSMLGSDGGGAPLMYRTGGGALQMEHSALGPFRRTEKATHDGPTVFRMAVARMTEISQEILERNGLDIADVDLFVPHQANLRIIDAVASKLELPPEKIAVYMQEYGNTTAATIPTSFSMAMGDGRVSPGDLVLLAAFGAGLTWGGTLIRWGGVPGE